MLLAPLQLKAMIAGAIAAAIALMALTVWGLYWRGEYREAKVSLVTLQAQGEVLAASVRDCSAGSLEASKTSKAAVAAGEKLLEEARKLHAGGKQTIARVEELIRKPPPPGANCEKAWDGIEAARGAR